MLEKIEARNPSGEILTLIMEDVLDGYAITEVEGLGPVKAQIVSSGFAKQDGAQYHTSRREPRQLTLKIGLEADYVIETPHTLRTRLYNFFMTKSAVNIKLFLETGLEVHINGRVEDVTPDIFAEDPTIDVIIFCPEPDFLAMETTVLEGLTTSTLAETPLVYSGTVETGVVFRLMANQTLPDFTIYHRTPDGTLQSMDVAVPMVSGDVLTISTVPGDKYARLLHLGVTTSVLYGVDPQATWFELLKGTNQIRVYADVVTAIPYELEYLERHGGL